MKVKELIEILKIIKACEFLQIEDNKITFSYKDNILYGYIELDDNISENKVKIINPSELLKLIDNKKIYDDDILITTYKNKEILTNTKETFKYILSDYDEDFNISTNYDILCSGKINMNFKISPDNIVIYSSTKKVIAEALQYTLEIGEIDKDIAQDIYFKYKKGTTKYLAHLPKKELSFDICKNNITNKEFLKIKYNANNYNIIFISNPFNIVSSDIDVDDIFNDLIN